MRKTNFSVIIEWVAKSDKLMRKSSREFFSVFDEINPEKVEELMPLFNEWLLFEFEFKPGTSVLQWYFNTVINNDVKADKDIKTELESILKTNIFQPFVVQEVKAGECIMAKGFSTQQNYTIYD